MNVKSLIGTGLLSLAILGNQAYSQTNSLGTSMNVTVESYKFSDKLNSDKSRDVAIIGQGLLLKPGYDSIENMVGPGLRAKPAKPIVPNTVLVIAKCSDVNEDGFPFDSCASLDAVLQLAKNSEKKTAKGSLQGDLSISNNISNQKFSGKVNLYQNLTEDNAKPVRSIMVSGVYDKDFSRLKAHEINFEGIKLKLYK